MHAAHSAETVASERIYGTRLTYTWGEGNVHKPAAQLPQDFWWGSAHDPLHIECTITSATSLLHGFFIPAVL
jgi:hypothetical protein